jgi:hypothetical protein
LLVEACRDVLMIAADALSDPKDSTATAQKQRAREIICRSIEDQPVISPWPAPVANHCPRPRRRRKENPLDSPTPT